MEFTWMVDCLLVWKTISSAPKSPKEEMIPIYKDFFMGR